MTTGMLERFPYRIRPGRPDEIEKLRAIEWAAQQAFATAGYPDLAHGETVPAGELRQAALDGLLVVAADAEDAPVGFALCAPHDDALYVQEVDVHPDHAGHRLAARMFEMAERIAAARGLPALTLTTFRHLPWNAPYYARLGFHEMTREEISIDLAIVIERQRAAGLDMANRVSMRRPLSA